MQRTIARIRPLGWAFAAVAASVFVSLMLLQPPAERLVPGAAPADRGHVSALILPAPHVARPVHREPAHSAPAPIASFLPRPQALRPTTPSAVSHPRAPKSTEPVAKPKTKPPVTPTPPPPVATPAPPPPTLPVALKRHGNGPPAHSNSRLLANRKQKKPAAPKGNPAHHGPPHGHGKRQPPTPPPLPPAAAGTAPVQPAGPPATPPGHGGTPPGQGGTPPGQGGTPPGHDKH
jgi:hypothetical protein